MGCALNETVVGRLHFSSFFFFFFFFFSTLDVACSITYFSKRFKVSIIPSRLMAVLCCALCIVMGCNYHNTATTLGMICIAIYWSGPLWVFRFSDFPATN